MLDFNQSDFLYYTSVLKSNYRKGVHALRAILEAPDQAEIFARNKGAVSVIFSVPTYAPDKNSDELLRLLQSSSVIDLAAQTYFALFYDLEGNPELLSDINTCRDILTKPLQRRALLSARALCGPLVATLAGLDARLFPTADALVADTAALNTVLSNNGARKILIDSIGGAAALGENMTALRTVCNNAGARRELLSSADAAMAFANNKVCITNLLAIDASLYTLSEALQNENWLQAIVGSEVAMNVVSGRTTATGKIIQWGMPYLKVAMNSMVAIKAIESSPAAISAFVWPFSTVSVSPKSGQGINWEKQVNEKVFLHSLEVECNANISVNVEIRYTLNGNEKLKYSISTTANGSKWTGKVLVSRFMDSVTIFAPDSRITKITCEYRT